MEQPLIKAAFYHLDGSGISQKIRKMKEKGIQIDFIDRISSDKKMIKQYDVLIFEEEDSYISCVAFYDRVISKFKSRPAVIIISGNKDMLNTVRWMRKGAGDCLWVGDLDKKILINSIKGTIDYVKNRKKDLPVRKNIRKVVKKEKKNDLLIVPPDTDWKGLKDNKYYDLTLVIISVTIDKDAIGRYSSTTIDNIYQKIKHEASNTAQCFGGKNWYWSNNSGANVFYFGKRTDCAVLSAVNFYLRFFLFCIEKLKLDEILKLKIAVHDDKGLYYGYKTGQITSDLVNSISHLLNNYTKINCLDITDSVHKKLSKRLKSMFVKVGRYENRDIYQYRFYGQ